MARKFRYWKTSAPSSSSTRSSIVSVRPSGEPSLSDDSGGGYFIDTWRRADGPVGNGWTDLHDVLPIRQDAMGIRSNTLVIASQQGPTDQDPAGSGWRGAIFRQTYLYEGVIVRSTITVTDGKVAGGPFPMAYVNPKDTNIGFGCWWNPVFAYWELGMIGKLQSDWTYSDTTFATAPSGTYTVELRSADGTSIALYVDGVRRAGPVSIPVGLRSTGLHGFQIDGQGPQNGTTLNTSSPSVGEILPSEAAIAADYVNPVISVPAAANITKASATSVAVPYPASVALGDQLIMVVGASAANITTPSGWTRFNVAGEAVGTPRMAMFTKTAVAADVTASGAAGSQTVAVASSTPCAGLMIRGTAASTNPRIPASVGFNQVAANTTAPTLASNVVGLHRTGIIGIAVNGDTTVTLPGGWTLLKQTAAGGVAFTLAIATRTETATSPFGYSGTAIAAQNFTLGSAIASATMIGQIMPNPS